MSAMELSRQVGAPLKTVLEDIGHIRRSLPNEKGGGRLVIRGMECCACGFRFRGRTRLGTPSRCPRCKCERISEPEFSIEGVMAPLPRQASRLIVVNPQNSVLLYQYEDDRRKWWATPGGGLEGRESFEEAAAREAEEELSLTGRTLTPLWRQTVEFTFRGQSIRQVERYFLVRLSQHEVTIVEGMCVAHRREGIVAARWWSLAELETTSERVFPDNLCGYLRSL